MALPSNFLGDLIASTQGGTVEPPAPNAFGQALQAGSALPDLSPIQTPGMTSAQAGAMPRIAEARPRRSILDMIGGIADTVATVGGATPLYQQNLDAQRARQIAQEDRQYEIEQRPLERQLNDMKLQRGQQEIESGALEIQGARNDLLNSAGAGLRQVFGRFGSEGVLKAWPLLAKQLGVPDEKAAQIGEALGADTAGTLAALFPDPALAQSGSKAKEVQIYELLKAEGDTETAAAYRKSLATGGGEKPMTAYQREQIRLAEERLGLARDRYENPPPTAAERNAANGKLSPKAQARMAQLPAISNAIDSLEASIAPLEEKGFSGAIGGYVPSALDKESDVFETNLGLVRQLIRGLTRVEGEGSISDYETKLQQAILPSRTQTPEGRRQAIANVRALVNNLQQSYSAAQQAPASAPRKAARGKAAPRQTKAIPKINSVAEYYKLPKGPYIDPDGIRRVKQ